MTEEQKADLRGKLIKMVETMEELAETAVKISDSTGADVMKEFETTDPEFFKEMEDRMDKVHESLNAADF